MINAGLLKFFMQRRKDISMDADGRKRYRSYGKKSFLYYLLLPLIVLNKGLAHLLRRAVGENCINATEEEILSLVDQSNESGDLETVSAEIINNVFEFDGLDASDVMTHRINIEGIEENSPIMDVVYMALEKGFSRIPVYRDSIDTIIGIIIVKDLLCLIGNAHAAEYSIKDFIRDVAFVPESSSCADTFKQLIALKSGMAVVIDEYGGTAGIVTIEDIIEAIMGDIEDEYDEEDTMIKQIGKEKYEIDGECPPDDVLELFGMELPDDHEYDTVAGFVTDLLGYIPENNVKPPFVDYADIRFVVLSVEDNCIKKLLAVKREQENKKN